jgi:hypothetical protein
MSEEHLSSRGESPVVNLPNGQLNASTGATKLSEVTYPTEGAETVDTEMKAATETEVNQESQTVPETLPTLPTTNQDLLSSRPPLQEQVALIRGSSDSCVCRLF